MYDQVLARLDGKQAPNKADLIIAADVDEILRPGDRYYTQDLQLSTSPRSPERVLLLQF
jgi:hypothetical protein